MLLKRKNFNKEKLCTFSTFLVKSLAKFRPHKKNVMKMIFGAKKLNWLFYMILPISKKKENK